MNRHMRSLLALLLLLGVAAGPLGCGSEPKPVDRVQTRLVDKSMFEGQWWYATTIVDVDYDGANLFGLAGASGPFEGSMSSDFGLDYNRLGGDARYSYGSMPIGRVRFVIDEDHLFAYRTYELTAGGNAGATDPDFRGQPLAVFKIEDHVDIRQDYDGLTGEDTNVRSENTSDRQWNERSHMRVDWSQNLITDFAANDVDLGELFERFTRSSVSFQVQEGGGDFPDSYRPTFVRVGEDPDYRRAAEWGEDDADTVHYMSFVNRETWTPGSCGTCSSVGVTTRNSFLRVPPGHEYAAARSGHREFDNFGFFRALQPTYARGGEDRRVQGSYCEDNGDCGRGGACDTDQHVCVGGLTSDQGETDFLTFYTSRHNLYADSLGDRSCSADWQCDGRYGVCGTGQDDDSGDSGDSGDGEGAACPGDLEDLHGSTCDPVAKRCTLPKRQRPTRAVRYHLSPHFPPYLVRSAFRVVADWNEALMRGRRAELAQLALDEQACDADEDGVCHVDLAREARMDCQRRDPTAPCYCGSAEDNGGSCAVRYDPFESPEDAAARGVPRPYDCYVTGPADLDSPVDYDEYDAEDYGYRFEGDECLLTLESNACDLDPETPCQQLGDLRYQFLNHIAHGAAPFAGVAVPLSDPHNGELVVSNANIASETLESMAEVARDYFAVLRGDVSEEKLFSGEHVRGYFSRLGRVERPVSTVALGGEGTTAGAAGVRGIGASTPDAPASAGLPGVAAFEARFEHARDKLTSLRGQEGRATLHTDQLAALSGTPLGNRLADVTVDEQRAAATSLSQTSEVSDADDAPQPRSLSEGGPLQDVLSERAREAVLASRNIDVMRPALYHSQYWQYWADAFADRPSAEASIRLQQGWFRAVMWHEMGHALGLRHNFAASLDRNQYHPAYFDFARNQPLPHPEEYDDPARGGDDDGSVSGTEAQRWRRDLGDARRQRLEAGAGNYMSSSVMDYSGDLSDFAGLGHYDRAAVLFGYFDHMEVYDTPNPEDDPSTAEDESVGVQFASQAGLQYSDLQPRLLWRYYPGGESCSEDSQCPHAGDKETTAFQDIRQRCVENPRALGVEQGVACGGGDNCVCSNFEDDLAAYAAGRAYRGRNSASRFAEVPYLYCQDGRINDLSWCTPHDAGESFLEVIDHYRRRWQESYPQRYFRNYNRFGPRKGYADAGIVDAAKIYQHFVYRLYYEGGFRQSGLGATNYLDQLLASMEALGWMTELIAAPDVGAYALDTGAELYRRVGDADAAGGDVVGLLPGQGYHLWSEYQDGLNGFFRLERAGTFVDKLLAMQALTERDWQLNYGLDERLYVNFYDLFPDEVVDVFGGLMLRQPRQYAPRLDFDADGDPVLHYLTGLGSLYGDARPNADAFALPAVEGFDSEALRTYATTLALASFPVYYDTSFEQRLLIFKRGSGEGYTIPATRNDGTPTCAFGEVACDDPDYIVYESRRLHTSYVAVRIGGGNASEENQQIAYRLLNSLRAAQERLEVLEALAMPDDADRAEIDRLLHQLERDEGYVEYLIELSRQFGISSPFF